MLRKNIFRLVNVVIFFMLTVSPAHAKKQWYQNVSVDGGALEGTVKFEGILPPPVKVKLEDAKNAAFCIKHAPVDDQNRLLLQHVEVENGYIKDAVIFLDGIRQGKPWKNKVLKIDFKNCQSFPKVVTISRPPKKSISNMLIVRNYDSGVLHNPKGYSLGEKSKKILFKKWLLNKGAQVDVTKSLNYFKRGRDTHFFIECEQHPWMTSSARIVWNPYYTLSSKNGSFEIDSIPPGVHKITVWHPYIGEKTIEVNIEKGKKTKIDLTLP
jgi:hypothetical protein